MKKKLTKKLKNNGNLVQLYQFEATGGGNNNCISNGNCCGNGQCCGNTTPPPQPPKNNH